MNVGGFIKDFEITKVRYFFPIELNSSNYSNNMTAWIKKFYKLKRFMSE